MGTEGGVLAAERNDGVRTVESEGFTCHPMEDRRCAGVLVVDRRPCTTPSYTMVIGMNLKLARRRLNKLSILMKRKHTIMLQITLLLMTSVLEAHTPAIRCRGLLLLWPSEPPQALHPLYSC